MDFQQMTNLKFLSSYTSNPP